MARVIIQPTSPLRQDVAESHFLRGVSIYVNINKIYGQALPIPCNNCIFGIDIIPNQTFLYNEKGAAEGFSNLQ